jgi:hypothetical protein
MIVFSCTRKGIFFGGGDFVSRYVGWMQEVIAKLYHTKNNCGLVNY